MAGKTLIGGTPYTVTGGKTLIGGTEYSIARGKTLIGGTEQTIEFVTYPTLRELFADMVEVAKFARSDSESKGNLAVDNADGYYFVFFSGYMSFVKVGNSGDSISVLFSTATSDVPTLWKYSSSKLRFSITGTSYTTVWGAQVLMVSFNTYTEEQIVGALENASILAFSGVNSSNTVSVKLSNEYLTDTSVIIYSSGSDGIIKVGIKDTSSSYGVTQIFTSSSYYLENYEDYVGVTQTVLFVKKFISTAGGTIIAME